MCFSEMFRTTVCKTNGGNMDEFQVSMFDAIMYTLNQNIKENSHYFEYDRQLDLLFLDIFGKPVSSHV
jgi:hypothetical protein